MAFTTKSQTEEGMHNISLSLRVARSPSFSCGGKLVKEESPFRAITIPAKKRKRMRKRKKRRRILSFHLSYDL